MSEVGGKGNFWRDVSVVVVAILIVLGLVYGPRFIGNVHDATKEQTVDQRKAENDAILDCEHHRDASYCQPKQSQGSKP